MILQQHQQINRSNPDASISLRSDCTERPLETMSQTAPKGFSTGDDRQICAMFLGDSSVAARTGISSADAS